ncbi:MAG: hypothetical protein NVSMB15_12080 [Steroidobacteraceae bacterium]
MSSHYFRFTGRGSASRRRAPLLERLLAGADACTAVADWRVDAFRIIAQPVSPMPGVAAAALYAEQGRVEGASIFMATAVQYVADMSSVRLPGAGILCPTDGEAAALVADFNRVWHDAGIRLLAGRGGDLFCAFDEPLEAVTHDPAEVLDRPIESYLPTGAGAKRLRLLMSEIEMWLFEHAVNRSRTAVAKSPVNGLWLWGGGAALSGLPAVDGWAAGDDPLFRAFAAQCGLASDRASPGVAVVASQPGSDAWFEKESRWLERSVEDLRAGRIARLDLSAGDRCFSVRKRWHWRSWRRRAPWWESLG